MSLLVPPNASLLMQVVIWFTLLSTAFAIFGIVFFVMLARRLNTPFHIARGRIMIAIGVGLCGVGAYSSARHHVVETSPSIDWTGLGVLLVGAIVWGVGEWFERQTKRRMKFLENVLKRANRAADDT